MRDSRVESSYRETKRTTKLNKHEKELFVNMLIDQINCEKDLEELKIELSLKEDFNLIDAFGLLDPSARGFVTPTEMREGLLDLGFRPSIDEVHLVFQRFNKDNDGRLKYSEFSESMMPTDPHFARLLGSKRMTYGGRSQGNPFENRTLQKYLKTWEIIIDNEKLSEAAR